MGLPSARITDKTAHGGMIVMGKLNVLVNWRPASRIADLHICPHVTGQVLPPCATNVLIGGKPAARVTDLLTCGCGTPDPIVTGEPTVLIGTDGASSDAGLAAMQASVQGVGMGAAGGRSGGSQAGAMQQVQGWTEAGLRAELARTPEGRAALANMPAGLRFNSVSAGGPFAATYYPSSNTVAIQQSLSDRDAANYVVHELTHARQYQSEGRVPRELWGQNISSWPSRYQTEALRMEHEAYDAQYADWVSRGRPAGEIAPAFQAREQVGRDAFNDGVDQLYRQIYRIR